MHASSNHRTRLLVTAAALLCELAHLGWEYLHGGVPAHHMLNDPALPAISNWWGALLIPALTWFLVGRILRRIDERHGVDATGQRLLPAIVAGFLGALVYGAGLSLAFVLNSPVVTYVFLGLFAVSVLVRTYRAQYVLGFVLGMAFTFGAVLPTAIALVVALFGALVHWLTDSVRRLVGNARARQLPGAMP